MSSSDTGLELEGEVIDNRNTESPEEVAAPTETVKDLAPAPEEPKPSPSPEAGTGSPEPLLAKEEESGVEDAPPPYYGGHANEREENTATVILNISSDQPEEKSEKRREAGIDETDGGALDPKKPLERLNCYSV